MPSITFDDDDIKKAINHLTCNKYHVNTIVSKKINDNGELEVFWSHK